MKKPESRAKHRRESVVSGDASLLRRMTGILLDNAIKYTPEGGSIWLALSLQGECIELLVSDTGVGICR